MSAPAPDDPPFARPPAPWTGARGLPSVLQRWQDDPGLWRNVALHHVVPARDARFTEMPEALHPRVREALARRGIERLYDHQARAFELARSASGEKTAKSVVVATPTASGKSLCYHLPVLDRLAREPDARALYLFPTKALSRDQETSLRGLMKEIGLTQGAITYDGDTPGEARGGPPRRRAG